MSKSLVAANIEHVNVGRIVVSDQSLNSQQQAGKKALAQVFVKLSGNPQVLSEQEVERAIDNYERFLTASSFLRIDNKLIFEATFNRQKVENLLMASGLSVWASLRPSSILWLATKTDLNNKQILYQNQQAIDASKAQTESLATLVQLQAYARGVEIILPIGDLEDTSRISVYDVWNQFVSYLHENSRRYEADYLISATLEPYSYTQHQEHLSRQAQLQLQYEAELQAISTQQNALQNTAPQASQETENQGVAIGVIPPNSDDTLPQMPSISLQEKVIEVPQNIRYKVDYIVTNRKKINTGTVYAINEYLAVQQLVDVYANVLAKQFALSNSNQSSHEQPVQLIINNIRSLNDYVALMSLIKSVPAVSKVQLVEQNKHQSTISVQQNISATQLRSILSLDPRLRLEPNTASSSSLLFYWQE